MVMDLVIVTAPNPPGSRASISPPTAVLEIAPAKVLQGAVRLHGLASSPTPETQVRDACALADGAWENATRKAPSIVSIRIPFLIAISPQLQWTIWISELWTACRAAL